MVKYFVRISKFTILFLLVVVFSGCKVQDRVEIEKTPVDYVNPLIGNISHMLVPTYPTIQLPNSMLRVYPKRESFTSDLINGLPMIVTGHRATSAFRLDPINSNDTCKLLTGLSYTNEVIKPYRYSVFLDEKNISVDFAPSRQSAIYSISSNKENVGFILSASNGELSVTENGIQGYQVVNDATVYLYLEMEQQPADIKFQHSIENIKGYVSAAACTGSKKELTSVVINFDIPQIKIRYGISYISIDQAKRNLYKEIKNYDIETLASNGKEAWNNVLSKIRVEGIDEDMKTIFYTALYRTYERMINISEDGQYYSAFDKQIHSDDGIPFYTDDWIWDTYRAVHPLRIIVEPEMEQHMIQSFVRIAQQTKEGWLPTFPEVFGDNHAMNGNHAIATIWDAYSKGLRNFDFAAAYEAARKTLIEKSLIPWRRIPNTELDSIYKNHGFFPALYPGEKEYVKGVDSFERRQAVAVSLADCYDSWCLAQMSKEMEREEDYKIFTQRSYNYRNIYNQETAFFHPKDKTGKFIEPFDYIFSGGPGARDYYDENNGWTYRWDVPHNIADLVKLMGGAQMFIKHLDQTFREPLGKGRPAFYAQHADHTGNVGQFSMGNEPSLHIPYLYCYAGEAWKTQKRVRTLIEQWFRNDLMGIPGDEDGGGMSAFVVFSSLGFYPVCPGLPVYVIGSPIFENATIQLGNGKAFTVKCRNYSPKNKFIESAKLNGIEWNKSWIHHDELMKGGELEFIMSEKPNKKWASEESSIPPSFELK